MKPESRPSSEQGLASAVNLAPPMLITSFGDGAGSKLKAVKQLPFEVR